ncbi:PfkB family carbohydrate kinase [Haladaptatus pallidirubidus]|uniref:PfkB family carbohydrate kinase n=1 Tax=Haladaptatus pallidirubidus TaxID=1008152 RepID=UPI0022393584|nr:PfkB family carbohydrate kinase [Haladaptatus pallidirubidus]
MDFVPDRPGQLKTVGSFTRRAGGAPTNVTVRLSVLDQTLWFWTRLSDDTFGEFLYETLMQFEIPDRFITRDDKAATTLAFTGHDKQSDRSFSFYRDQTADTRFQTCVVPNEVLQQITCVYVASYLQVNRLEVQ